MNTFFNRHLPSMPKDIQGTTMIEVLVTIIIIAIGLLGMAGLQARSTTMEFESYQRGQALILLQDMVERMNNNATDAASYITTGVGTGVTSPTASCTGSRATIDLCEWGKSLLGTNELKGTTSQGAMLDGKGCISSVGTNTYQITIVWQAMSDTVPPVANCGGDPGSSIRGVSSIVRVPDLGAS